MDNSNLVYLCKGILYYSEYNNEGILIHAAEWVNFTRKGKERVDIFKVKNEA